MRKCNFLILFATKEGENGGWWQDLRCALLSLERNLVFVTNQFVTTCNYLLFVTIVGYFFNYFLHLVVLAITLQLPCD